MTDSTNLPEPSSQAAYDGWRSITLSLLMTLIGYGVLVGIPVISSAWVELLGFSEVEVGRVAGADLGGLSAGAVLTSILIRNMNRRALVLLGGGLAIAANWLCTIYVDYQTVLWLRFASGVGSGIYTAVAVATLGATSRPARAFNLMLFAFAFSQALEMQVLPMLSMNGIYYAFIGCFAASLVFVRWIPPFAPSDAGRAESRMASEAIESTGTLEPVPSYIPWLCLGAIFVTYINIGAYWTYIELAASDGGVSDEWIGRVLVIGSFFSIVGCLFATLLSNRFGLARPLFVALAIMAVVVGMLAFGIGNRNILVSVFSFNLLWIFIDVYQMSTVAKVDRSGSFASLMPGAQGLGQIVGPNLAASILGAGMGYSSVFLMCATAALGGLVVYAAMYLLLNRVDPTLVHTA